MKTSIVSVVENGTDDEIMTIISRLENLPEFGLRERVTRVTQLQAAVSDAEVALSRARSAFYGNATGLVRLCVQNWSPDEILEATGYDSPPPERQEN